MSITLHGEEKETKNRAFKPTDTQACILRSIKRGKKKKEQGAHKASHPASLCHHDYPGLASQFPSTHGCGGQLTRAEEQLHKQALCIVAISVKSRRKLLEPKTSNRLLSLLNLRYQHGFWSSQHTTVSATDIAAMDCIRGHPPIWAGLSLTYSMSPQDTFPWTACSVGGEQRKADI